MDLILVGDENYSKTYYIPRFLRSSWIHMRSVCTSFGMEVLSLDTEDEYDHFMRLCLKKSSFFDGASLIGAVTNSRLGADGWFWLNSGERISYALDWAKDEPNFSGNVEFCLSMKMYGSVFKFNDVSCNRQHELQFICQQSQFRNWKLNSIFIDFRDSWLLVSHFKARVQMA